jgi:hypothetical protein
MVPMNLLMSGFPLGASAETDLSAKKRCPSIIAHGLVSLALTVFFHRERIASPRFGQ